MPDEQPDTGVQGMLPEGDTAVQVMCAELIREKQALKAANEKLQRANEMQMNFVSMAVHELRNPLNPIAGYIEMLLEGVYGQITEEQSETLVVMQRNVHRLETITSELVDMAQIEAGRVALNVRPIDLAQLMEAVVAEHRPQIEARSQVLTLRALPDLPLALCDELRITQVVVALLGNASNNTPGNGQVMLTVARAPDEDFLLVTVTSASMGIAPDQQGHIVASSPQLAGIWAKGLGLHVARLLVELHGGQIWVENQASIGSTFVVTLPVAP